MTKTLTEQWREGTLPLGTYYIVNINGDEEIDRSVAIGELWNNTDLKEVLAPVPSYDHFSQLVKKVERLQERLNECEEALVEAYDDCYDEGFEPDLAKEYLEKWGVK